MPKKKTKRRSKHTIQLMNAINNIVNGSQFALNTINATQAVTKQAIFDCQDKFKNFPVIISNSSCNAQREVAMGTKAFSN